MVKVGVQVLVLGRIREAPFKGPFITSLLALLDQTLLRVSISPNVPLILTPIKVSGRVTGRASSRRCLCNACLTELCSSCSMCSGLRVIEEVCGFMSG